MGMSPKEYDCITYYDLRLKIEGFREAQKRYEQLQRKAAYAAFITPHINPKQIRGMTEERFWPMAGDKKKGPSYRYTKAKKRGYKKLLQEVQNATVRN